MAETDTVFLKVEVDVALYQITGYFANEEEKVDAQMMLPAREIRKWLVEVVEFYNDKPFEELEEKWHKLPELQNEYSEALKGANLQYTEFCVLRRALLEIELLIK